MAWLHVHFSFAKLFALTLLPRPPGPVMMTADTSRLALLNAALFVMQAAVNVAYAHEFVRLWGAYETLISPATFALLIWLVIYVLEGLLVLVDVFYPECSLYADATKPMQLRACFALSCVTNTAWVLAFVKGHVYAATVLIYLLWLVLLMLYIYSVNDRNARGSFDWKEYACNELPIALYFGWVTVTAFTHLAMSLQQAKQSYLAVEGYVVLLSVVLVMALLALLYAEDGIVALATIWYLVAIWTRPKTLSVAVRCADMSVRACAAQGAMLLSALLLISWLHMLLSERYVGRRTQRWRVGQY